MELPVNSIDSYRRMHNIDMPSVGKFGMGFFSILYWLIDQPQRNLIIYSKVVDQPAWILDISYQDSDFIATFRDKTYASKLNHIFQEQYNTSALPSNSGTFIYLLNMDKQNKWQPSDYGSFQQQLHRLRYITDVQLYNGYKGSNNAGAEFILNELNNHIIMATDDGDINSSNDSASIILFDDKMHNYSISGYKMADYAQGISLNVLFGSLLIPSISTKTIERSQRQYDPFYKDRTGLTMEKQANFVITVGNIIVYAGTQFTFNNKDQIAELYKNNQNGEVDQWVYRLDYPIYAKLPVARDDVVVEYNSMEYDIMWRGMQLLIDQCIDLNAKLDQLFDYLHDYANYSDQPAVHYLVQQAIDYAFNKANVIYLPSSLVVELLQNMSLATNSYKLSYLQGASLSRANEQLHNYLQTFAHITLDNTFKDITVVVLPGNIEPTSAGMPSFLFISRSQYEDLNWAQNLTLSYTNVILQRRDEPPVLSIKRYEDVYKILEVSNYYVASTSYILHEKTIRALPLIEVNRLALTIYTKFQRLDMSPYGHTTIWKAIENVAFIDVKAAIEYMAQINMFIANFRIYYSEGKSSRPYLMTKQDLDLFDSALANSYKRAWGTNQLSRKEYHNVVSRLINTISIQAKAKLVDGYTKTLWRNVYGHDAYYLTNRGIYILDYRQSPIHMALILYYQHGETSFYQYVYPICIYIMNNMRTSYEGAVILKIFLLARRQLMVDKNIYKISVANYMLNELRYRFNAGFMHHWSRRDPHDDNYAVQYWEVFYRPMIEALKLYSEQGDISTNCHSLQLPARRDYRFSANQLLDYVFAAAIDNIAHDTAHTQLRALLQQVVNHPHNEQTDRPQFQSVSIAVNEGTTKNFAQSVMTELLQNSIDAIRSQIQSAQRRININLCRNNNRLTISVQDYVGIPDNALLSLWIPFLSSKSTADLMSTGEMGTGFFNVYRQPYTEMVVIETNDLTIVARPIINNNRVVDILYDVTIGPAKQGTTITIHTHELSVEKRIDLTIDVGLFINNIAGLNPFELYYNSELIHIPTQLIYQEEVGAVYLMEERQTISYIMTNGVPMMEMMPYLEKIFGELYHYIVNMGFVIDINKGYYQPVHSRSHLREVSYILKEFLTRSLFYMITYKLGAILSQNDDNPNYEVASRAVNYGDKTIYTVTGEATKLSWVASAKTNYVVTDEIFNKYLNQGSSYSDLSDLMYYITGYAEVVPEQKYKDYEFSTNHDPKYNLVSLIQTIAQRLLDAKEIDLNRIWQILQELQVPNLTIIWPILRRFFEHKRPYQVSYHTADKDKVTVDDQDIANTPEFEILQDIFTRFVQSYYSIGQKLVITSLTLPHRAPSVVIEQLDTVLGMYERHKHTISLNAKTLYSTRHALINSWNEVKRLYQNKQTARMTNYLYTSALNKYIGNVEPAAVLIHELQHSVLVNSHEREEGHPQRMINGQIYGFSAGATYLYTQILRAGLWDDIFQA